jgi:NTE family protein/lysophospholipid hydrolase
VLGGGGARGLSHVGALRAIDEAGIPVDAIGGTSMGAVVAAARATGLDHQAMHEACKRYFVEGGSLLDFTFPVVALTAGRRISRRLAAFFGDARIEDLLLTYFCVSSNLTRAEAVVHREGIVWKQLRASISLPGILPPVFREGDLLVDGAVTNNLPVDVMKELCHGGCVIALDVTPPVDLTHKEPFPEGLSGWRVLGRRLNPFMKKVEVPPLASVLMRTTLLGSASKQNLMARQADLVIRPPLEQFGLLEFKSYEQIVEIGYKHALEELEAWSASRPGPDIPASP